LREIGAAAGQPVLPASPAPARGVACVPVPLVGHSSPQAFASWPVRSSRTPSRGASRRWGRASRPAGSGAGPRLTGKAQADERL